MEKITCLLKDFSTPGTLYTKEAMEKAVKDYMSKPEDRRLGELGSDGEPSIRLMNVSHKVENLEFIGEKLYCDVELLDTPMGEIAQKLVKSGQNIHLAPRMTGNPVCGIDGIQGYEDLNIISVDIVRP